MKNRINASWSAFDRTLLCTWLGVSASRNAATSPALLPKVSFPRKYTGMTVSAPHIADDQTSMNPTASLIESKRPSAATAGRATDML